MGELTQKEKISTGLAAVLVVACFLPWINITTLFGSISFTPGFEGDGLIIILLAVALLIVELVVQSHKSKRYTTLIIGVLCLGIFGLDFLSAEEIAEELTMEGIAYVDLGFGLILGLVASFLLVLLGLTSDKEVPEEFIAPDAITANVTYCPNPNCGKQNKRTDRFCFSCGTELTPD